MWWIILWILAFVVLVILHEFWHFTAAKKSWVKVKEFWLWLPPKITTLWKDKSWTEYTLNRIPLGWFVQLKWEDWLNDEENKDKDSFVKAKLRKKLIIVLAWVAMNVLTAWVIFTISFSIWMKPMSVLPEWYLWIYSESFITPTITFLEKQGFISWDITDWDLIVTQVLEESIAQKVWIQSWAIIKSINNTEISQKNLTSILEEISNTKNNKISYILSWELEEKIWEFNCWEDCKLWIVYNTTLWDFEIKTIKFPIHKAMLVALKEIGAEWNLTMDNLKRIWWLFKQWEAKEAISSLSWPVAIVKVWQVLFENLWFLSFLWFAGMISVALAIMNVLPIPALDWWRFWTLIIQKVFRIKEEKFSQVEWYVNRVFFRFLMIIWIIIILKDLTFWWVHIPFFS